MYVLKSGLTVERERKADLLNTCAPVVSGPFPFQQRPFLSLVPGSPLPHPTMLAPNPKGTRRHLVLTPAIYFFATVLSNPFSSGSGCVYLPLRGNAFELLAQGVFVSITDWSTGGFQEIAI